VEASGDGEGRRRESGGGRDGVSDFVKPREGSNAGHFTPHSTFFSTVFPQNLNEPMVDVLHHRHFNKNLHEIMDLAEKRKDVYINMSSD
jgi:hypothetical protein